MQQFAACNLVSLRLKLATCINLELLYRFPVMVLKSFASRLVLVAPDWDALHSHNPRPRRELDLRLNVLSQLNILNLHNKSYGHCICSWESSRFMEIELLMARRVKVFVRRDVKSVTTQPLPGACEKGLVLTLVNSERNIRP
jgi:hypothetical protein